MPTEAPPSWDETQELAAEVPTWDATTDYVEPPAPLRPQRVRAGINETVAAVMRPLDILTSPAAGAASEMGRAVAERNRQAQMRVVAPGAFFPSLAVPEAAPTPEDQAVGQQLVRGITSIPGRILAAGARTVRDVLSPTTYLPEEMKPAPPFVISTRGDQPAELRQMTRAEEAARDPLQGERGLIPIRGTQLDPEGSQGAQLLSGLSSLDNIGIIATGGASKLAGMALLFSMAPGIYEDVKRIASSETPLEEKQKAINNLIIPLILGAKGAYEGRPVVERPEISGPPALGSMLRTPGGFTYAGRVSEPVGPPVPARYQRPEVPGTPAEPRMSITEEIRAKNARTKEEIRALFPNLTREQARQYAIQVWGTAGDFGVIASPTIPIPERIADRPEIVRPPGAPPPDAFEVEQAQRRAAEAAEAARQRSYLDQMIITQERELEKAIQAGDPGAQRKAVQRLMELRQQRDAPPAPAKGPILPKAPPPPLKRSLVEPPVPETPAEAERDLTVIQEIRNAGARTRAEIKALFPKRALKNEEAARLRDLAWGKQPQPPATPPTFEETTPAPAPTVSKPLMITREMEQALSDLGWSKARRNKLTPEQAQDILSKQRTPPPEEPPAAEPPGSTVPKPTPPAPAAPAAAADFTDIEQANKLSATDLMQALKAKGKGTTAGAYDLGEKLTPESRAKARQYEQAADKEAMDSLARAKADPDRAKGLEILQKESFPAQQKKQFFNEAGRFYDAVQDVKSGKPLEQAAIDHGVDENVLRRVAEAAPAEAAATLDPKPGYVRLYHGEGATAGAGAGGSWFTDKPDYAAQFGKVSFVDVPADVAAKAREAVRQTGTGGPHFIIPDDYVKQAKEMATQPGAKVFDVTEEPAAAEPPTPGTIEATPIAGKTLADWEQATDVSQLPKGTPRAELAKYLAVPNQPSRILAALRNKKRTREIHAPPPAAAPSPIPATPPAAPEAPEKIVAAAYQPRPGITETGANHPEILKRLGVTGFESPESRNTPQFGFQTDKGRFITREEAGPIAEKSGQNLKEFEPGEPVHSNEVASPTQPEKPLSETGPTEPAKADIEQMLKTDVPDVSESREAAKFARRQIAELEGQRNKLLEEQKALEKLVLSSRGWQKGRIKSSAKAKDVKRYREITQELGAIHTQQQAIRSASAKDALATEIADQAKIAGDTSRPMLHRIGARVRIYAAQGIPVPNDLNAEFHRLAEHEIKNRYPDATKAEVNDMRNEVERAAQLQDDLDSAFTLNPALNSLYPRRIGIVENLAFKSQAPYESFSKELRDKIAKYTTINRPSEWYGKPVEKQISARDLEQIKADIARDTERVHKEAAELEQKRQAEQAAEQAKEAQLMAEAQASADSAKRSGTKGGRSAKDVKTDLVSRLSDAIDDVISKSGVTLEREAGGRYVAKTADDTLASWGEIEEEGGKFKVVAQRFGQDTSRLRATVDTQARAEWFIKAMSAEAPGKAVIGVPGDGVYTLLKSGKTMLSTWLKARGIDTHGGFRQATLPSGALRAYEASTVKHLTQPPLDPEQLAGPGSPAAGQGPDPVVTGLSAGSPGFNSIARKLRNFYSGIGQLFKRGADKQTLAQLTNAADNIPRIEGQRAGNTLRNRTDTKEQNAITFVMQALKMSGEGISVEATERLGELEHAGDPLGYLETKATDMETKAQEFLHNGQKLEAQAAIDAARHMRYAKNNFGRLRQYAELARRKFDAQYQREQDANIAGDYENWHVPQRHDLDLMTSSDRPIILGHSKGTGTATGFRKAKVFEDYATAIENGFVPRSFNIADLLEHRVNQGERLIQRKALFDRMKSMADPVDGRPLAQSIPKRQITRPDGTIDTQESVPRGYQSFEVLPGYRIAVHDGYAPMMRALTGTSQISESAVVGTLQDIAGVNKHLALALDTFHASRIMQAELALTGKLSVGARQRIGRALVEYDPRDLAAAVRKGEITQEMADYITTPQPMQIGGRTINVSPAGLVKLGIQNGLNAGRFSDALYRDWIREIPITGEVNKWVFDKLSRSAITHGFLAEFERVARNNPELNATQVARKVASDINVLFGNLQKESIFRNPSVKAVNQILFLAPNWVEALARRELRALRQFGEAGRDIIAGRPSGPPIRQAVATGEAIIQPMTRIPRLGTVGRGIGHGLAAYFVGTQVLNLITRHQLTFRNPEPGHKLDAWIPDVSGKTKGFFISPLSVFGEIAHDILRYSREKADVASALTQIGANKMGNMGRMVEVLATGRDPASGEKLLGTARRAIAAGMQMVPVPISLSQGLRAAGAAAAPGLISPPAPGAMQRQLLSSAGLKTEPAGTAQRQIYALADKWKSQSGSAKIRAEVERRLKEDFGPSDYKDLRTALLRNDLSGARRAFDDLRKTKEPQVINRAMRHPHPFTGSAQAERAFVRSLSDEDKKLYREALEERKLLYSRYRQMLAQ